MPGILVGLSLFIELTQAEGVRNVQYNSTHWNVIGYCHTAQYGGQTYYAQTGEELKILSRERVSSGGIILP